jgi:hypothetical protein
MTEIDAAGRTSFRRAQLALALLAATLLVAAGVQALAPAPAAAAIDLGEECADPTVSSIECETTGGSGGSEGGAGEIVGPAEVIEVEGAAPSPCVAQPSLCEPSEVGGRHGPHADGAGQAPHGRHGGKPTKLAQTPEKDRDAAGHPSLGECKKVMTGDADLPLDQKLTRYSEVMNLLSERIRANVLQEEFLRSERLRLEGLGSSGSAVTTGLTQAIGSVERERFALRMRSFEVSKTFIRLQRQTDDELQALWRGCKDRFPGLWGD